MAPIAELSAKTNTQRGLSHKSPVWRMMYNLAVTAGQQPLLSSIFRAGSSRGTYAGVNNSRHWYNNWPLSTHILVSPSIPLLMCFFQIYQHKAFCFQDPLQDLWIWFSKTSISSIYMSTTVISSVISYPLCTPLMLQVSFILHVWEAVPLHTHRGWYTVFLMQKQETGRR